MIAIDDEMYQRAKARGIMLLTAHFAEDGTGLTGAVIDEVRDMLPAVNFEGQDFAELMALLAVLTSWAAADIEESAEREETTPLVQLAQFAEYLREAD